MTAAYCTDCVHLRHDVMIGDYCAYTLDERRNRPCPPGDGCTARLLLTGDERAKYRAAHTDAFSIDPPETGNDYIFDKRGVDTW